MKWFHLALLVVIFTGCDSNFEQDKKWAEEYYSNFIKGISIESVHDILSSQKDDVQFYNNCLKIFEYPMVSCSKGYSLVTGVDLPRKGVVLGQGTMQIYFTFNEKQILIDHSYEIYYPAHHR